MSASNLSSPSVLSSDPLVGTSVATQTRETRETRETPKEPVWPNKNLELNILGVLMHVPAARGAFHEHWSNACGTASPAELFSPERAPAISAVLSQTTRVTPQILKELGFSEPWVREAYNGYTIVNDEWLETFASHLVRRFKQFCFAQELSDTGSLLFDEHPDIDNYIGGKLERIQTIAVGGGRTRRSPKMSDRLKASKLNPVVLSPTGTALDPYIGGIDLVNGDWIVTSGREKNGKTRLVANIVLRLLQLNPGLTCCWLSTEPNSSPEKLGAQLVAMLASDEPLKRGEVTRGLLARDVLSNQPPEGWEWRIKQAEEDELFSRLFAYGPLIEDGNCGELASARALALNDIIFRGARLLVVDNYQQFQVSGNSPRSAPTSDYEKMSVIVPAFSSLMKYRVVQLGISQFSRQGEMRGGGGLEDRMSTELACEVSSDAPEQLHVTSKRVRNGPAFDINLQWDMSSGWLTEPPNAYSYGFGSHG